MLSLQIDCACKRASGRAMSAQDAPIEGLEDLDEATRALVVAKTREHRARMQELVDLGLIEAVGTFVVPKN